ncbi:transcription elongation factor TFIIS [Cryptotrichosporon argae]
MDASKLSASVKQLNEASAAGKVEDLVRILKQFKTDVEPTEDLLRTTRAGVAVGKLRPHADAAVSALAKEIVKLWKDAVEESKKKRKRDEDGKDDVKRVKAEGSTGSPAASTPDSKPDAKDGPASKKAAKSESPAPLSTIDGSRATPRTAKADGASPKAEASDEGEAGVRDKCVVMIYDALAGDSNAQTKILSERAISIEFEAFKLHKHSSGNDYRAKMRSLFLNLKDKGNPGLRNEIVLGHITAEHVVRMSKEEMASESVRALNEKIAENNLFKAKAVGETQAETDAFKCSRCQQRKCTYYQMQTRSADEPMTS